MPGTWTMRTWSSSPKTGIATRKTLPSESQRASAKALGQETQARMPKHFSLEVISRTAYWVEWWGGFGPPTGNEPRLTNPSTGTSSPPSPTGHRHEPLRHIDEPGPRANLAQTLSGATVLLTHPDPSATVFRTRAGLSALDLDPTRSFTNLLPKTIA